jgi:hypothetical protein
MKHIFALRMSIGSALFLVVLAALFAYFVNI